MTNDGFWEARYQDAGYRNHYPWSSVVTFVFRNRPRDQSRQDTAVLEVGCGNGANLWFCAREGFRVSGLDASQTAINAAQQWFADEGLTGDFQTGSFAALPFASHSHHLAIDRAALSFAPVPVAKSAIREVHRVLAPKGRFMFTPYTDRCTSFSGARDPDGTEPALRESGSIHPGATVVFYDEQMLLDVIGPGWNIISKVYTDSVTERASGNLVHSEWNLVLEKVAST